MLNYQQLSRKPDAFKSITGISPDEFQALLAEVEPRYLAAEQKRLARRERQRAPGGGLKSRHDLAERLLMTMIWLRLYLTCEAVGVLFGFDKSTVSRHTGPILRILCDLGVDTLGWPEEAQALVTTADQPSDSSGGAAPSEPHDGNPPSVDRPDGADLVAIIDATEPRIERSHD